MLKRFKNIKPGVIIAHLIITLAYPAIRAFTAEGSKLLLFTDALTIIGALLIVIGIFYGLALHGDFDRVGYTFMRGVKSSAVKDYSAFQADSKERREESFNYPLFLGIVYIVVSVIIGYGIL